VKWNDSGWLSLLFWNGDGALDDIYLASLERSEESFTNSGKAEKGEQLPRIWQRFEN